MLNHHIYNTLIQIISTDGLCVKNYQLKSLKWDETNKYTEDMTKNYDDDDKYGVIREVDIN